MFFKFCLYENKFTYKNETLLNIFVIVKILHLNGFLPKYHSHRTLSMLFTALFFAVHGTMMMDW